MKKLLLIAICAIAAPVMAADIYSGPYIAEYVEANPRSQDGDTFVAKVAVWPQQYVRTKVRVLGVNTPEKAPPHPKCSKSSTTAKTPECLALIAQRDCEVKAGYAATRFTKLLLKNANKIELKNVKHGKFAGRVIADVLIDGNSLSTLLINAGHGRSYFGGKREAWCSSS